MLGGSKGAAARVGIALAGLFASGVAFAPANAADLGGDCCADLEERIAELEATTVRKGNRKVSVALSGHINRMIMWWDDGVNDDVYVVDNAQSESRFRMKGSASIAPGWSAGFLIEMELISAESKNVNARVDGAPNENADGFIRNRKTSWHLKNDQLGKITVGRDSSAADDILLLNIAKNPIADAHPKLSNAFRLVRPAGTLGCNGASCRTGIVQNAIAPNLDRTRTDIVRYDTPSLNGLVLSAAWGEDDVADVAIRYKKEWNSIRLVAGIGYLWDTDEREGVRICPDGLMQANCVAERADLERLAGSLSVMHVPSGLYVYAAGDRDGFGTSNAASPLRATVFTAPITGRNAETGTMWYLQAGVKRPLLAPALGATTLYGEYQEFDNFGVRRDAGTLLGLARGNSEITDSSAELWGVGIVQDIDPAAMKLYAGLRYWEFDVSAVTAASSPVGQAISIEDFVSVAAGGRIHF